MHFDWYQATIDGPVNEIIDHLGSEAGEAPDTFREGRGRQNYERSFGCYDADGERIFEVLHGGPNGAPNITASGHYANDMAEAMRSKYPVHRVSRIDVAQDVVEAGAYERMESVCREIAHRTRVKGLAMVPEKVSDGRTYYLGAKSSDRRVRLYDKTAEQMSRAPKMVQADIPADWTRIELQWRPQKTHKEFASSLDPEECWFSSGWTAALARRLLRLEMNRIQGAPWRPDPDRAMMFMVQQYARHLEELAQKLGGWAELGEDLGKRCAQRRTVYRH